MAMRILLIEDDEDIASFVTKGLRESGFAVDHADNGENGLHLALVELYDVIIVDLLLPKVDGLTLIAKVREKKPAVPLMILSARRSVDDRVKGLQMGSDDYLAKPFAFSELLARVNALIRRSTGASDPTMMEIGGLSMDLLSREVFRSAKKIDLQPREFALLEYLMRNAGRVVSKTMIMEHVWDYNFDPQTNVVEARMSRLRTKSTGDSTGNLSKRCGERAMSLEKIHRLLRTLAFRLTLWYAAFFAGGIFITVIIFEIILLRVSVTLNFPLIRSMNCLRHTGVFSAMPLGVSFSFRSLRGGFWPGGPSQASRMCDGRPSP
jgi:two-component system OmpR family response regulator